LTRFSKKSGVLVGRGFAVSGKSVVGVIPNPRERGEGSAFAADAKEKADSSGKIRPRNDQLHIFSQAV
jgi:hypothetical protein